MADFPRSLIEFQRRFPDEAACAAHLAGARWPDGFRCPHCGHGRGWKLATKAYTWNAPPAARALGVYHGLRLQAPAILPRRVRLPLQPRRTRHAAFRSLLGIAVAIKPATYKMLIRPEATA